MSEGDKGFIAFSLPYFQFGFVCLFVVDIVVVVNFGFILEGLGTMGKC